VTVLAGFGFNSVALHRIWPLIAVGLIHN